MDWTTIVILLVIIAIGVILALIGIIWRSSVRDPPVVTWYLIGIGIAVVVITAIVWFVIYIMEERRKREEREEREETQEEREDRESREEMALNREWSDRTSEYYDQLKDNPFSRPRASDEVLELVARAQAAKDLDLNLELDQREKILLGGYQKAQERGQGKLASITYRPQTKAEEKEYRDLTRKYYREALEEAQSRGEEPDVYAVLIDAQVKAADELEEMPVVLEEFQAMRSR